MSEQDPIESLLNQVADLLKQIQTHRQPIKTIPPEVIKKLELLEQTIYVFEELNRRSLQAAGIDIQKLIDEESRKNPNRPLLQKTHMLEQNAKILQGQLQQSVKKALTQESVQKKETKERQKKFKRLGGKGWIPL